MPLDPTPEFSVYALLAEPAGESGLVSAIEGIESGFEVMRAARVGGMAQGADFALSAGEGVIAHVVSEGALRFRGSIRCPTYQLVPGVNVIGVACAPPAYSAFQMLSDLGAQSRVGSIERLDLLTGRLEAAVFADGVPAGRDFAVRGSCQQE